MPFTNEGLIMGGVFGLIGLAFILYALYSRKTLTKIVDTPTSTAKQLEKWQSGQGPLPGRQDRIVEVKGMIKCDNPLRGEFSGRECAYFRAVQSERVSEVYYENGKRRSRTNHRTISDREDMRDFWVQDATGKVLVQPRSAEIDGEESVNRFDRGMSNAGSFLESLAGSLVGGNRRKVEGIQFTETILPLNRRVYVLGELAVTGSGPVIRVPAAGGHFLVSVKSEEDLVSAKTWKVRLLVVAGIVCIAVGLGLLWAMS